MTRPRVDAEPPRRPRPAARAWNVPEVLQASSMDCGPAALASLLAGLGLPLHYGRLREACQTQVDGTSIDTLEEALLDLGVDAEQIVIPLDHLLERELHALPALAVTVRPGGYTHFVVLWRRMGGRVMVMDPAVGRRWLPLAELGRELFVAERRVPAEAFREYAGSEEFGVPLARRLARLVTEPCARRALELARADATWRSFAALDAAARAVAALDAAGKFTDARERSRLLESWFDRGRAEGGWVVPRRHCYASPAESGEPQELVVRGVVLVRARLAARSDVTPRGRRDGEADAREPARPALEAARRAREPSDGERLWRLLGGPSRRVAGLALVALLVALGVWLEPLLLRGLLDLDLHLGDSEQRRAAGVALLAALSLLGLAEACLIGGGLALGATLEGRLRVAALYALPRLPDAYFKSRSLSDLAERAHMLHWLRHLPEVWLSFLRLVLGWLATAGGLIWLDPSNAARVVASAAACLGLPLAFARPLSEHDRRVRTMVGALSRFHYDALRGLPALAAHGGERALRAEHEAQLTDWKRAGLELSDLGAALEAGVGLASACCSAWLFWHHLDAATTPVAALLYLYWCLSFPSYGRDIALLSRQLPALRNLIRRVCETLEPEHLPAEAPCAAERAPAARLASAPGSPAGLHFEAVSVQLGGHTVLDGVDLKLRRGEHVAVVGASGAGKSTLLGLLLGWHSPSAGRITLDGAELDATALRERCVWVDPSVQLFNRSLHANLIYAAGRRASTDLSPVLASAELEAVIGQLPLGLQTPLGEAGTRLSGGEGQRVRLARGLLRERPELVLLDEPFRGLDPDQRARALRRVRQQYHGTTLLFATHDLHDAASFERVLVFRDGRIVEDGPPRQLLAQAESWFEQLLRQEQRLLDRVRNHPGWRRVRLHAGGLHEEGSRAQPTPASPSNGAAPGRGLCAAGSSAAEAAS